MIIRFGNIFRNEPKVLELWERTLDYLEDRASKEINEALEEGVSKLEDVANQGDK